VSNKASLFFQDPKAQMRIGTLLAFLAVRTGSELDDKAIEGIKNALAQAQLDMEDNHVSVEELVKAFIGLFVVAAELTETEVDDIIAAAMEKAAEKIDDYDEAFKDTGSAMASLTQLIPIVLEAVAEFRAAKEAEEAAEEAEETEVPTAEPTPSLNGAVSPPKPKVVRAAPKRTVTQTPGADNNAIADGRALEEDQ